jgi:hypothetical protein
MRLKRSPKGFLLSCSSTTCKQVWWVPKFVKSGSLLLCFSCSLFYLLVSSVVPQENNFCQKCFTQNQLSVTKLLFSFNLSKAPSVGLEPHQLICPSCDPVWKTIDHPSLLVHRQQRVIPTATAGASVRIHDHQQRFLNPSSSSYQPLHNITNNSSSMANSSSFVKQHPSLAKAPVPPPVISYNSSRMDVVDLYDDEPQEDVFDYGRDISAKKASKAKSNYQFSNSSSSSTNSSSSSSIQNVEDIPQCNCGLPSVVRLSKKDNENKGRSFYTCSKGM